MLPEIVFYIKNNHSIPKNEMLYCGLVVTQ
jgi:hypothetical protein